MSPSNDTYYIGQKGLRKKFFNTTYGLNFTYISNATEGFDLSLAMDLEAPYNVKNGHMG